MVDEPKGNPITKKTAAIHLDIYSHVRYRYTCMIIHDHLSILTGMSDLQISDQALRLAVTSTTQVAGDTNKATCSTVYHGF